MVMVHDIPILPFNLLPNPKQQAKSDTYEGKENQE